MTPLQRHLSTEEMMAAGYVDENRNPVNTSFKSAEQGAARLRRRCCHGRRPGPGS
jgi:hypothetical protein